jgi:hypothetical protein
MQEQSSRELWVAFLIIGIITFLYLTVIILTGSIPAASEFLGHSLGVIGFLLMLMTETLYSLRKRRLGARWGRIASWLNFHIISGIVGPYLVLLHTAWKFNGLAGLVMLLTTLVVLSGFIGRYIYTAVPRRADGAEIEAAELERLVHGIQSELNRWLDLQPEDIKKTADRLMERSSPNQPAANQVIVRFIDDWHFRSLWNREIRALSPAVRRQFYRLNQLLIRRRQLIRQVQSLATARQLLSLWHTIHIPIGMALFTAALIHIGAAIYFATLLR